MRSLIGRNLSLALALVFVAGNAFAQRERGSIVGRVSDSSGAVIPGVAIRVTGVDTGVVYNAQTTGEGIYAVPALPSGTYRVEAKKEGFKTGIAGHIEIGVAQQVTIDLTLQVGTVAEQVTVTAEAPLLDQTSPEIGSSMNDKLFHELPIAIGDIREAQTFIFASLPGTTGDTFSGSINGGQLFSHEIMIDGISIARFDISGGSMDEFSPSVDAIGEFKLQANNYSAEYGESQSGIVSFRMKSGTNQFHGSLYEYHRNRVLDAAGWGTNTFDPNGTDASGNAIKNAHITNNFGGTFGGPVRIPKLYNGRDKTFFFFAFDGLRNIEKPRGGRITMPTPDQLTGDFSRLLGPQLSTCGAAGNQLCLDALGRPIYQNELYNPATTRTVAAGAMDAVTGLVNTSGSDAVLRDGFGFNPVTGFPISGAANAIPQSDWSKVSSNILPFYSQVPLISNDIFRNIASSGTCCPWLRSNTWSLKIDHNINAKHKLSSFFNYNKRPRANGVVFFGGGPINLEQVQSITGRIFRLSEDWTVNDHFLNHFAVGYNRFANPNVSKVFKQGWAAKIGLTGATDALFPQSTFGVSNCFGNLGLRMSCIGSTTGSFDGNESFIFLDDMNYTRGKHQFKWGGELRRYRDNVRDESNTSGVFGWSNAQTALPGFQGTAQGGYFQTGWPFASFLLGTADNAYRNVTPTQVGDRQGVYALYFQDDWRATPKLTVSYGLRWDIPMPRKEAFSRMSSFDPTAPNPAANNIPGALVFLKKIGRSSFQDWYFRQFGPRLALAYQLTSKTVLRSGYSITYAPPNGDAWCCKNTQGFNSKIIFSHNLPDPRSPGSGSRPFDPVMQWDLGFPPFAGTLPITDPAYENFDHAGDYVDWLPKDSLRMPYVQSWTAGFEHLLPMDSVLELDYIGNKGTRLIASMFVPELNAAPTKFMAMVDAKGNALVNKSFGDLTAGDWAVLNSFGVSGKPYPSFPDNVPISQALKRFPQFAGINDWFPDFGASSYHSMQVSWRKRPSHGLTFIAAYTFSKTITNSESGHTYHLYGSPYSGYYNFVQWPEHRQSEKAVADFDTPHSLKLTWAYDLPVGRGRKFLNRGGILDGVLGGWKVTSVENYLSGTPLVFASIIPAAIATGPYGNGHWATRPDMNGSWSNVQGSVGGALDPNGTPYLNVPSDFGSNGCKGPFCPVPTTADGYALHPGNAPRVFGNIRGPGRFSEDLGLIKDIRLSERAKLEFLANFFNVFNRHGFGNPDTVLDSSTFGKILGNYNGPRSIQFALRLNF